MKPSSLRLNQCKNTVLKLMLGMFLAWGLSGCGPLLVSGAATTAVAASEERGVGGTISDAEIHGEINQLWFHHDLDMYQRLDMTIYEGRVLLTGAARDEGQRLNAVRLAWQAKGVKEVYNEITLDNGRTPIDDAKDTWITTQVKARLTFDPDIKSQNYKIETNGTVVYLLGVAQSQKELDKAEDIARHVPDVTRVVSYVQVL